jgi:hypothetical protein
MMQKNYRKTIGVGFLLLLVMLHQGVKAQNINGEIWGAYVNTIQLNDHWKVWNDYHYVTNGFGLIRPGITYQTKKGYQFTIGYAYVKASTPKTAQLIRNENRIWGQAIRNFKLSSKFQYIIRFRYDARFRASLDEQGEITENQYTFNNRFRLMQDLRYRLTPTQKENYWHFDFINETLLNTGIQIDNGIDQIRSYLMIGYSKPNLTLLAGYHQRFIPSKSQNWTLNQGFTIWLIQNIDITKKH